MTKSQIIKNQVYVNNTYRDFGKKNYIDACKKDIYTDNISEKKKMQMDDYMQINDSKSPSIQ